MASRDAPRRIVLAAISTDDVAIESLAPPGDRDALVPTPLGLQALPLRFRWQAAWWGTAASIGTGVPPRRHGVLTALAIDEDGADARPRRESDSDRPWIWDRFDRSGLGASVCGWPAIADLRESGVPAATAAAVLAPRRLEMAAAVEEAGGDLATMLRPPRSELASVLATAVRAAVAAARSPGPHARERSMVETVCAASERLDAWIRESTDRRESTSLRCLGLQLRPDPRETEDASGDAEGNASEESGGATDDAHRRERGELLATALARVARGLGPDDVLLAAVVGDRQGGLWHRGLEIGAAYATAVDIAPTALAAAGIPITADLPGRALQAGIEAPAKSWDLSGWRTAQETAEDAEAAASVAERVRRARRTLANAAGAGSRLRVVLLRHLESQWSLALDVADWPGALLAAQTFAELRGAAIDLWRLGFAAERAGERAIVADAVGRMRREHPEDPATALTPLLEGGRPSRELIESIDLSAIRIPTQRSVVGRAAAQIGLDELARRALAPLVAADRAIPADRLALASVLLKLGKGTRALAALGGIGAGPGSPKRLRLLRAKCLDAAARREEALALLDHLLIEAPFDTEARTLRERIAAGGASY